MSGYVCLAMIYVRICVFGDASQLLHVTGKYIWGGESPHFSEDAELVPPRSCAWSAATLSLARRFRILLYHTAIPVHSTAFLVSSTHILTHIVAKQRLEKVCPPRERAEESVPPS